jgi:hypothetical protein
MGVLMLIASKRTKRHSSDILVLLALIAAAAFLLGAVLPGIVAKHSGVFYQQDIDSKVTKLISEEVKKSNEDSNKAQAEIHERLARISVQPFYQHIIMYFWPIMYFCLGTLVFVLSPPSDTALPAPEGLREVAIMSLIVFMLDPGLLILRVFFFNDPSSERVVYAYPNPEISRASFVCQIVNFLIFSILLGTVWHQWLRYYDVRVKELEKKHFRSGLEATFDVSSLERIASERAHWQICLATLSIGFVVYTGIYWKQIIQNKDYRFVFEAIGTHSLWLISAVLVGMPFWKTWRAWRLGRIRALGELVNQDAPEVKLSALRELRPVGSWNIATVLAAVLSATVAPLIQLVAKLMGAG